jgi:periplasmic divalent cation tolerance protein
MARWGESGLALRTLAFRQNGIAEITRAQASAPMKLGILPAAPGKRATFLFCSWNQTCSRISSLVFIVARIRRRFRRPFTLSFLAAFTQYVVILQAMQEFIVVYVTAGSPVEGDRLARALVEERLAACVNRIAPVQSVYRWDGKVEQSEEQLLIIKTQRELFTALEKRVRELHSYAVPEIVALPIIAGSEAYLRWLADQTTGGAA